VRRLSNQQPPTASSEGGRLAERHEQGCLGEELQVAVKLDETHEPMKQQQATD